ncbi:dipeptide/oligopeptide/nickel ABC transporter ATP-binding protein, partial [bacterium]|nr:dipeptide/oligopeptide/nickel ABC transporter ATP-binding protein [bacterium]
MAEQQKLLEVDHIRVEFGKKRHPFVAVDDVSFDIYQGEIFGLVGESGSGKTTIGRAIIRANPLAAGEIRLNGKRISGRLSPTEDRQVTRDVQMIFQDPMDSLNERAKVGYIVAEGLYAPGRHYTEEERREKVNQALSDVGLLPEFASRFPHEFSGGQRQRIGIARALALDPEFIVCDEPISALDVSIQAQIVNLLERIQAERGISYLFIAHDLTMVRHISRRIGVMYMGSLVEMGEA